MTSSLSEAPVASSYKRNNLILLSISVIEVFAFVERSMPVVAQPAMPIAAVTAIASQINIKRFNLFILNSFQLNL